MTKGRLADADVLGDEKDFVFLTVAQVIALHAEGIRRYSPTESYTLRDPGLLDSVVMTPQQTFGGRYLYPTLTRMAAAYLVGLAFNHAFENGNKQESSVRGLLYLSACQWVSPDAQPGRGCRSHAARHQPRTFPRASRANISEQDRTALAPTARQAGNHC